jgi:hypothetical protein
MKFELYPENLIHGLNVIKIFKVFMLLIIHFHQLLGHVFRMS